MPAPRSHPFFRWLCAATAALALAPAVPADSARVAIVVDDSARLRWRGVVRTIERDHGAANIVRVYNMAAADLANPIARGRFLARVAAADLVVPVGGRASALVSVELNELPAFFVAGDALSGRYLSQPHVGGIFLSSPEDTIQVAKTMLPGLTTIGVLYTRGYEPVVNRIRSVGNAAGLVIRARRVEARGEIGAAAADLSKSAGLLWVAGDPLLLSDVILSYLLQESLRAKRPLVSPVPAHVRKGALFCTIPDPDLLAKLASSSVAEALSAKGANAPGERLKSPPSSGLVLINRRLAERWRLPVPSTLRTWSDAPNE